ncbi:5945_t:CDS:2, partial [Acaulospora morrowiae]
ELESLKNSHRVFTIKASYGKQRKTFSWPVDISTVTLDTMKLSILEVLPFPQDTKPEDLTLRFAKADEKNCEELGLGDDATFQQYLKSCAVQASFTLKVQIDTVQKPFSDWKLSKVCELLGLASGIDEFPTFDCGIDKLDSEKAKDLMAHLCKDLRLRYKAIHGETEATRSEYVSPFLVTATSLFDGLVKLYPQLYVAGKYGRGPLDFCLRLLGVIIGVVEVKKEDFDQGMAQNVIQLHSSLETNRKRKHDEIEDEFADKAYGIVTDGRVWYFVEFIMDGDKPKISVHSETPAVLDWTEESESLDKGAGRILGRIVWLLKEAEQWGKLNMAERKKRLRID